ncbi:5414_t:CDS:2 [Diversispora eburnea]|uniref:MTOR-associated protein MEAK7 n=1 Tax=Diversispora eburnea TaxID=1213867 RepID=A0A9N9APF1_9GLOM|nr:5414_t:CDS:2 [Diversispora eburnea]
MGNHPSKTYEAQYSEILSHFSEDEKTALLQNFNEFSELSLGSQKHEKPEVTPLSIKNHLPPIIGELLKDGFVIYIQSQSIFHKKKSAQEKQEKLSIQLNNSIVITKLDFISAIYNLIKTAPTDQSQAAFIIGQLSTNTLRTFVEEVIRPALVYWFEGSYFRKNGQKNKKKDSYFDDDASLINYLICFPKLKYGKPEDDNLLSNIIKESEIEDYFNQGSFMDWFIANIPYQNLFNILLTRLFLHRTISHYSEDEILKSRLSNVISPQIFSNYSLPNFSRLLSPADYYMINSNLPPDCRTTIHTLLFSSARDGESWHAFINLLLYKGSTILVIKDKNGYIFGGFSYKDWELNPKFYGDRKNFLFSSRPKLRFYPVSGYNDNFQYLNFGTKTLPNGMGGQFDYCGLWIDSDFNHGHSKAALLSTTYNNPRLSKQENFLIEEVEVWLVKPTTRDPDDIPTGPKHSALDRHPAELELIEMATDRKMYSKNVREPDVLPGDDDLE